MAASGNNQNIAMEILVEDIMTDRVETIKPDMLIGQLAHIMLRRGFNGFPVVEEDDKLIGIVTFTDLFHLLHGVDHDLFYETAETLHQKIQQVKSWPVSRIMTDNVTTVTPQTTLNQVIEMVSTKKIHTFPVLQDGKLVGILGREDVLNATFSYG